MRGPAWKMPLTGDSKVGGKKKKLFAVFPQPRDVFNAVTLTTTKGPLNIAGPLEDMKL